MERRNKPLEKKTYFASTKIYNGKGRNEVGGKVGKSETFGVRVQGKKKMKQVKRKVSKLKRKNVPLENKQWKRKEWSGGKC